MKRILIRAGWGWLLAAPTLIALLGCWQVGSIACDLELRAASSQAPGGTAAYACPLLGYGSRIGAGAVEPVSAADLASVRIAVLAFVVATLFGAIGVLAGYKAFLVDRPKDVALGGPAHRVTSEGEGAEVLGAMIGDGARSIMTGLIVKDGGGVIVQTLPERELGRGETWRWTILAAHAVRPSELQITAVLEDSVGRLSDLSSKWKRTAGGYTCLSFNRIWR